MTESTRLRFDVKTLRQKIEERRDRRIAQAEEEYAHETDIVGRRDEWRAEAEKAVRALNRNLRNQPDAALSGFSIPQAPRLGRSSYSSPERERDREIEDAKNTADRMLRRLDALTTKDSVSLTPKMLADYFGL